MYLFNMNPEELSIERMELVNGGVDRTEYCMTLASMWVNGTYQGGFNLFASAWGPNCGAFGYDFEAAK
jgi:hypothetical protein